MKKTKTRAIAILLQFMLLAVLLPSTFALAESSTEEYTLEVPKNFKPLTEEEIEALYSYDINDPNTIVVTQSPARGRTALPKAVDNSTSKYFPEIGDQGVNGLCQHFSDTYYGYTYMTARLRDIDVKSLGKEACFAPYQRFSYDVKKYGAVLWSEAPLGPYNPSLRVPLAPNITTYDLPENVPYTDAADWRYALKNKALGNLFIDGYDIPADEYIELLKTYIGQGYVLSSSINTANWRIVSSKDNPDSNLDDGLYEKSKYNDVIFGADLLSYDHQITLVGYNDDVWADLNANGTIEPEELGAFKIANSWGKTWGKDGYIWISYDAFFEKTQIPNHFAPNRKRNIVPSAFIYLPREELYTPELLVEFNFKAIRNEDSNIIGNYLYIGYRPFGSSDDVKYSKKFEYILMGLYDRVGYEGTRVYDLTDFVAENNLDLANKKYEWFLKIDYATKDKSADLVALKDFKLTDADGTVLAASNQELSFDGKSMSDGKNTYTNPTYDSSFRRYVFSGTMKLNYGATARANGPWEVVWRSAGDVTTASVANNEIIEAAPVHERDGYTFMGWYTDNRFAEEAEFPYAVTDDTVFYAKWVRESGDGFVHDLNDFGAAIDLNTETLVLPDGYSIAAYSIDGGGKWKKGMPKIPSLLNKPLRLAISDTYDTKTKRPEMDSIIEFPGIEARPKSNPDKLIVNYAICADLTGATAGAWTLAKKGNSEAFTGDIEIALSQNKKTPDGAWVSIGDEGIPVQPYGAPIQTYLARTAPIMDGDRYVPASKIFKLKPKNQQKQTKVKANYKTETIKLKVGQIISGLYETPYTATATDKKGISISEVLDKTADGTVKTVSIWTPATDKKPASKAQEYKLAMRSTITPQAIAATNGKVSLPKTLEVYSESKNKWGTLPKFSSTVTLENAVRVKSTAKATGVDDSSQLAASKAVDLTVNYDGGDVLNVVIGETEMPQEIEEQAALDLTIEEEPEIQSEEEFEDAA